MDEFSSEGLPDLWGCDDWPRRCWWVLSILELSQFWKNLTKPRIDPCTVRVVMIRWSAKTSAVGPRLIPWVRERIGKTNIIQFGSWDWKRDEVESVKLKLTGYYDSVTWGGLWVVVMLMDHQQADQVTTTTSLCRIMNVMLRAWLQPVSLD